MDVPILGNLFKSRNESMLKTEIVIFLTPKIYDGSENYTDQPLELKRASNHVNVEDALISANLPINRALDMKRSRILSRSGA